MEKEKTLEEFRAETLAEFAGKSRTELEKELLTFRELAPRMLRNMYSLNEYRALGATPDQIRNAMNEIHRMYAATIALKDKQLDEMMQLLEEVRDDPLGIDNRLKKGNTKFTIQ